jgi:hypothetical protein
MLRIVPLIPARLVQVALVLGAALQGCAVFLPEHLRPYAWGLGAVAWLLAGLGARMPRWLVGKPLVPLALAPVLLAAYELAERYTPMVLPMLPESLRGWAGFALGVLALLAGKVLPEPVTVQATASTGLAANPSGPVVATISEQCSLADRVRGLC